MQQQTHIHEEIVLLFLHAPTHARISVWWEICPGQAAICVFQEGSGSSSVHFDRRKAGICFHCCRHEDLHSAPDPGPESLSISALFFALRVSASTVATGRRLSQISERRAPRRLSTTCYIHATGSVSNPFIFFSPPSPSPATLLPCFPVLQGRGPELADVSF